MDIKSFIFLNFFCLLVLYFNPFVEGDSLYGLCANSECSAPISRGITILRYSSPDDSKISVEPNEEVQIYVKDYGPKKDLWGVIVRGNKGYISKNFIRETNLFAKKLIPASFEFQTHVLGTDSYTVSSHLHVSSQPHQPDMVSPTTQHMHTSDYNLMSSISSNIPEQNNFISSASQEQNIMNSAPNNFQQQQDFMNSAPNTFQQQQDFMNSAPNTFQQQQDAMNSAPNTFQQQQDAMNSAPNTFQQQQDAMNSAPNFFQQQQDFINSAPNTFQQQPDFVSSTHSNIHQEWNSLNENQMYNSPSFNPVSNPDLQPQLHQSSQFSNFPKQSSQFMHSENDFNPHEMNRMQSPEILPSATYTSDVHSPSHQHFPSDPVMTSLYDSSINSVPNSFEGGTVDPNVASPSQGFQSLHQPPTYEQLQNVPNSLDGRNFNPNVVFPSQNFHNPHQPSYEELQNIQSPQAPGIHPSLSTNDYLDDDYSKTLAMLSSRGFEGAEMYADQEAHVYTSSQNDERNFDSNVEFNSMSSQSQQASIESSSTTLHSSMDPTLHINENKMINSNNPQKFSDNILSENTNSENHPSENLNTVPSSHNVEESTMKLINEDNLKEENEEELELLDEESMDDEPDDENEEDEEDGETDVSTDDESVSENIDRIGDQINVQSSSSSQMNLQTSEGIPDLQSSQKDSTHDSNTVSMFSGGHSTVTTISPSGVDAVPQETKFSADAHSTLESSMTGSVRNTEPFDNFIQNSLNENVDVSLNTIDPIVSNIETAQEKKKNIPNTFSEDLSGNLDRNNNEPLTTESSVFKKDHTTPKISDFLLENEKRAEVERILSPLDIDALGEDLTTYQNRNLKGEYGTTDDPLSDSEGSNDENNTQPDSDSYSSNGNWFDALKAFIDAIVSWIPEPLYSALMDLQNKGISPRVPVFTTLCGFTCIFLIVPLFYLKDRSKENRLSALLAEAEKNAYTLSAANVVLEEKLESVQTEVGNLQKSLNEEKSVAENLRMEFENQAEELENAKAELDSCLEVIDALKDKENEYLNLINDYEKEKECYAEHKESLNKIMQEQESSIEDLTSQLQESEDKVQELEKEKEQFVLMKTDYEDKLALFDRNCNQLLQEAEVWNMRVKELTENVNAEVAIKEELTASIKAKDEEIESLKEIVETFKVFDEIEDPEEQAKTKEEKLQSLLNSVTITNQLKKEEEKSKILDEQLQQEKNKILDMEVELLEAKSEIDKLKLNYNQALQDKAEAQTKLEVLTNYFKDKEIQLQRQLGAQEADRQKKEDNVNSAERRIMLMEQENASYKSQVASMKQEMEETERTLRSQIAAQEKKAHENWIAARAAERNLENMKQEVTQLRQRLTLLEREQENWANAARDEIIRPVPKRIPGVSEESGSQEASERGMFPPPPHHERLHLPPMMLPPDRPLPPLPPPPMPPMFLPPPPPPMDRHFRPQPWHMPPPDHSSDYRTTPPEFMAGRESTPPRGRPPIGDGDGAPNTSSPMLTDTRDSRNSTPPHLLPDFHDIPPQPGRPYFPPPMGRPRYPMHPPYRRDAGPEPRRLDNQNESNSRGPPQPPPSEQWQHSRV